MMTTGFRTLLDGRRHPRNAAERLTLRLCYHAAARWCAVSGIANGLPVPPPELTWLVAGHYKVVRSLQNGIRSAGNIREALSRNGLRIDAFHDVLDFGCGSGRILRNWKALAGTRVHGTDFNPEMVRWCRTNLRFAHVESNALWPPLCWKDETFGFVYAFSVFTHLDEPLQRAWVAELRRTLGPAGHLMITTHGAFCARRLSDRQRARFEAGELVIIDGEKSGSNACAVYHPESWVREHMSDGFEIVDHIPAGASGTGMQDIYLLKKT
jgi:SAM-dependent methyltransferase